VSTRLVPAKAQRGITLIVTMVMLVMMTLFALSAIRISNINMRIVGNYQWQKEMEVLTDSALEQIISRGSSFDGADVQGGTAVNSVICVNTTNPNDPRNGTVASSTTGCPTGLASIGTVTVPRCVGGHVAEGYTKKLGELAPDDNEWVIRATASDAFTGARMTIYRGVTVRMLAGNCPE